MAGAVGTEDEGDELAANGPARFCAPPACEIPQGAELLYSIFELSAVGMEQVALDGRLLMVNGALCRLLGYSQSELLNKTSEQITFHEDRVREAALLESMLLGEREFYEIEKRYLRRDGSPLWANLTSSLVKDAARKPLYRIAIVQDITARERAESERKRAEDAMREGEEHLHVALASTRAMVYDVDVPTSRVNALSGLHGLLGYELSESEKTLQWWDRQIHPDDLAECHAAFARLRIQGQGEVIQYRVRDKDGRERWVEDRAKALRGTDSEIVRIVGTVIDITERKQAEEALHSSLELQAIIDGSPDTIVFVKDVDGRFLIVNSRFEELLGISRDQVRGKTDYDLLTKDRADYYRANDQLVLTTGRPIQVEELALLTDGKEHTFLANKFPLIDARGRPYAVCAISADITERKRIEEALLLFEREKLHAARNEQMCLSGMLINAQEDERARLASELHDDFSQRLAILALGLEAAAETVAESPAEAIRQLHELVNSVGDLAGDLHTLSHRLHSSTLEQLGLAVGVAAFCKEFTAQRGIEVAFSHKDVPPSVPHDISLCLFRIVQEGLRNIQKHSRAAHAQVKIETMDNTLHLSIFDDGVGYDVHDVAGRQGLGLLSMRERVRLVDGRFELDSRIGEGTRIDVWAPLKE